MHEINVNSPFHWTDIIKMYGYQNNFSDVNNHGNNSWCMYYLQLYIKQNMILQFSKNQALKPQQALSDNFKSF